MGFGKFRQRGGSFRKQNAAAGDDHRLLRVLQYTDGLGQFILIGADAAGAPDFFLEEAFGIVIGLGLGILAHGERHGAAFGWIGEHHHGAAEGGDQLFRPCDAVEVA